MLKQDVEILEANLKESPYIQIISNLPENIKPKDAPPPQQVYREYDNPGGYQQQPVYGGGYEQYPPGKMNPGPVEHDPQLHKPKYGGGYYPGYPEQVAPGPMAGPPGKHQPPLPQEQYYIQQDMQEAYQQPYDDQDEYLADPSLGDQGYRPAPPPQYKAPNLKLPAGGPGYQPGPNHPGQYPINPNPQQYHPQNKPYEHPGYPQYTEQPNPRFPGVPVQQPPRKTQLQPSPVHPSEQAAGPMIHAPYLPKPMKEKVPPQQYSQGFEPMDPYRPQPGLQEHYRQEQPVNPQGLPYYPKKKEPYGKAEYRPEYDELEYEHQTPDDYSGYYPAETHPQNPPYYKPEKTPVQGPYVKPDRADRQPSGYERKQGSFHQGQHSGSRGEGSQHHAPHSADHSQHSQNQPQPRRTVQPQTAPIQTLPQPAEKVQKEPAPAKVQSSKKDKAQLQPAQNTKQSASKQKPGNFEDNVMDSTPSISKPSNPIISSLSSVSSPTSHPQPAQSSTSPVDPPASDTLASTPDVKFIDPTVENINRKPGFNRTKKRVYGRDKKLQEFKSRAQSESPARLREEGAESPEKPKPPKTEEDLEAPHSDQEESETELKPKIGGGTFHFNESSGDSDYEFEKPKKEHQISEQDSESDSEPSDEHEQGSRELPGKAPEAPRKEASDKPQEPAAQDPSQPILPALDTIEENNE